MCAGDVIYTGLRALDVILDSSVGMYLPDFSASLLALLENDSCICPHVRAMGFCLTSFAYDLPVDPSPDFRELFFAD